jgi:hypothetical protein
MVKHLAIVVVLLSSITIACSTCSKGTGAAQESCSQQHSEWVAQALQRMQSVKPGMTRKDLRAEIPMDESRLFRMSVISSLKFRSRTLHGQRRIRPTDTNTQYILGRFRRLPGL